MHKDCEFVVQKLRTERGKSGPFIHMGNFDLTKLGKKTGFLNVLSSIKSTSQMAIFTDWFWSFSAVSTNPIKETNLNKGLI